MCRIEHSYAAGVQLEDEAFFGVYSDAIAGKFPAVIDEPYPVA
jgi:hypothetical protein